VLLALVADAAHAGHGSGAPAGRVTDFMAIAAGLLAVSVGVFAFVPLIIELALQRSADADRAYRRARHADTAFDLLLTSIAAFGVALLLGVVATYTNGRAFYLAEVTLAVIGIVTLLLGTLWLGGTLRVIRKHA
jgi:heme/copper-type cytochrome/quinol oxidase subunit 2